VYGEFQNSSSPVTDISLIKDRRDKEYLMTCARKDTIRNKILEMMADFNELHEKKFLKPNNLW
jgi:hypothetical protein